jgi:hypothetical protein
MHPTPPLLAPLLAYIDPGTGSMLVQLLAAGILGGFMAVRRFRDRVFGLFRKREPESDAHTSSSPSNANPARPADTLADEAHKS